MLQRMHGGACGGGGLLDDRGHDPTSVQQADQMLVTLSAEAVPAGLDATGITAESDPEFVAVQTRDHTTTLPAVAMFQTVVPAHAARILAHG